jgi:imidazoleglycerol-phosphate dehydratase
MSRRAKIQRKTSETSVDLALEIDGKGDRRIATPVPFFNHMLEAVAKHGLFDLEITATGEAVIPMDETLVSAAVDFGGRAAFVYRADALKGRRVGTFDVELGREFFGGFVSTALCNLHLEVRYGENAHHMIEALFKAFARAASMAARHDPRVVGVPSTKGTLTS